MSDKQNTNKHHSVSSSKDIAINFSKLFKVEFTDCWEFDKEIPESDRWMASVGANTVTAPTKEQAFEETIISLKVLLAFNSDYNLPSPTMQPAATPSPVYGKDLEEMAAKAVDENSINISNDDRDFGIQMFKAGYASSQIASGEEKKYSLDEVYEILRQVMFGGTPELYDQGGMHYNHNLPSDHSFRRAKESFEKYFLKMG